MFSFKNILASVLILIGIFIASKKAGIFASIANIIGLAKVTVWGSNRR